MCFQTHTLQLIDIKQLTKTRRFESLLPSHSDGQEFLEKLKTISSFSLFSPLGKLKRF
jgi:hypothetical protein